MSYRIFTRTWWKENSDWPDGLEPAPGRKYCIGTAQNRADAIELCDQYNSSHDPGRLSKKAEFEEE